jgi:hypothetical protein
MTLTSVEPRGARYSLRFPTAAVPTLRLRLDTVTMICACPGALAHLIQLAGFIQTPAKLCRAESIGPKGFRRSHAWARPVSLWPPTLGSLRLSMGDRDRDRDGQRMPSLSQAASVRRWSEGRHDVECVSLHHISSTKKATQSEKPWLPGQGGPQGSSTISYAVITVRGRCFDSKFRNYS